MPSFTVRVGLLLVIFGIASYVMTHGVSVTAFIPSVVGALLAVCGLIATRSEGARKHAMHAAAVIALLGLIGTVPGLMRLPALLSGAELPNRPAIIARSGMALLLLVYLWFSIKSFGDARRARSRATLTP